MNTHKTNEKKGNESTQDKIQEKGQTGNTPSDEKMRRRANAMFRKMFRNAVVISMMVLLPAVVSTASARGTNHQASQSQGKVIQAVNHHKGKIMLVRNRHHGGHHRGHHRHHHNRHHIAHGLGHLFFDLNRPVVVSPNPVYPPVQLQAMPYHWGLPYLRSLPTHCGQVLAWNAQGQVPPGWPVDVFYNEVRMCRGF